VTNNSRFDRYMRGDKSAMSISEREGFAQFKRSGCGNCHNGPMFSDYKKHILGVNNNKKLGFEDKGIDSTYAFRTPSLRNLRFTAPYMHNGTMPYLLRVLEFYEDISGGKNINPHLQKEQLDPLVKEINLRVGQMRPIMSFLNTLNDEDFDKSEPESVPSGLPVGGNIQ
jgi:cytochrome c peroxidase